MQIDLSHQTHELLLAQMARDGFTTAEEAIEKVIHFYESHRPTMDSLNAKLREAHQSATVGDVEPFDGEDIKRRGRQRLDESKNIKG